MIKPRILIVDDELNWLNIFKIILKDQGYEMDLVQDGDEAWRKLQQVRYNLVITDVKMKGKTGMELLALIKEEYPDTPVIVITAYGTIDMAVQAMKAGAYDYITKPFENELIKLTVRKALAFSDLKDENRYLREAIEDRYNFKDFIGDSPKIKEVLKLAAQVAKVPSTVLVQAENGTGKEILVRLIHYNSPRAARPFITFNCAAFPDTLLESELFGHEKGAFTGADKLKLGRFELANTGTIFLDEVGDLSQAAQAKLLRVLQERCFERLGGTVSIQVDVRVIAATNQDLRKKVKKGTFREDLYYRLNVFPINIPPLREHKEDIPLLVEYILKHFSQKMGKQVTVVSKEAMGLLGSHSWPGNVRELRNYLERAIILCEGKVITPKELPHDLLNNNIQDIRPDHQPKTIDIPIPPGGLEEVEIYLIKKALRMAQGNQCKAAALLKITRNTLRYRMEKYHITPNG